MRTLIKNVMVVTMENEENVISRGYILIEENRIAEVRTGEYNGEIENIKIIDGDKCAAIPGLINCHTHIPMTLLRGYGEGLPLMRWLNEKIWPFEAKLTTDDIYFGTLIGSGEMIKGGTTAFVDMYFMEEYVAKAAREVGIRAYLGSPILGEAWKNQIDETLRLNEKFKNDNLINIMMAPHSPYTCNDNVLREAGNIARENRMSIHIHLSETMDEVNIIKNNYGKTSTELLRDVDVFQGNNVIAAHCVHVSNSDMDILKEYGVTAVYNPQSNMKLASGTAPVCEMIEKGINVAIGTDGASSNNNLNMIEEMQTASFLQKLSTGRATALSAYETLKLATVNAAKAIGMESELGKIKEGYLADIALVDLNKLHMVPLYDVYTNIVFASQGGDVKTVLIDGNVVMEDYVLKTLDEEYLKDNTWNKVQDILNR